MAPHHFAPPRTAAADLRPDRASPAARCSSARSPQSAASSRSGRSPAAPPRARRPTASASSPSGTCSAAATASTWPAWSTTSTRWTTATRPPRPCWPGGRRTTPSSPWRASAGGRPDIAIMHASRVAGYAPGGLLDPWDLDLLAEIGVQESDFLDRVWAKGGLDGKQYSIALDSHPFIMMYNLDVAEQAGVLGSDGQLAPIDSPDQFLEVARAMQGVTGKHGLSYGYLGDGAQMWRLFYTLYKQHDAEFDLSGPTGRGRPGRRRRVARVHPAAARRHHLHRRAATTARPSRSSCPGRAGMFFTGVWELPTAKSSGLALRRPADPDAVRHAGGLRRLARVHAAAPVEPGPGAAARDVPVRRGHPARTRSAWAEAGHIPAFQPVVQSAEYQALVPQAHYATGRGDPQLRPGGLVHAGRAATSRTTSSRPSRASTSTAPTRRRASTPSSTASTSSSPSRTRSDARRSRPCPPQPSASPPRTPRTDVAGRGPAPASVTARHRDNRIGWAFVAPVRRRLRDVPHLAADPRLLPQLHRREHHRRRTASSSASPTTPRRCSDPIMWRSLLQHPVVHGAVDDPARDRRARPRAARPPGAARPVAVAALVLHAVPAARRPSPRRSGSGCTTRSSGS